VRIDYDMEYAIWNDTDFGPQRRSFHGMGDF
jgi:hypothetical protein